MRKLSQHALPEKISVSFFLYKCTVPKSLTLFLSLSLSAPLTCVHHICENFCWIKILSSLASFISQKKFVEIFFANAIKVAISSIQSNIG